MLKAAPANSSSVFGLYGEWGSGKTSVKNLVVRQFKDEEKDPATPIVVEFNPWAFSSQAELFQAFFDEVAKALGRKDAADVAVKLAKLGAYLGIGAKTLRTLQGVGEAALVPGATLVGVAADSLEQTSNHAGEYAALMKTLKSEALEDLYQDLREAIGELGRSILIVIDDLDRLPPAQLLQMFQVVRVNASLPRINFLLLLDRVSIVHALKTAGYTPEYLEKIVQFSLDLPHFGPAELRHFAELGLREIASETKLRVDWDRWQTLYKDGCQYVIDTPRKVRRLLHTFRFHLTIFSRDGVPEVDVVDLFALEVIRLHAPELWLRLPDLGQKLFGENTWIAWYIGDKPDKGVPLKEQVDAALAQAPDDIRSACKRLMKRLLPQLAGEAEVDEVAALSTCRLCTSLHFDSYFLLRTNDGYPTQREGEELVGRLAMPAEFLATSRDLARRYSFAHLLVKLGAIQKDCTDAGAIETMLATVWRLDEEDAAIAPVDGEWDHREKTEGFSWYFLQKIPDAKTRVGVAERAFDRANAVHPLLMLTARELGRRKKEPHRQDFLYAEEDALALQKRCGDGIDALRQADRLIFHPVLGQLLWRWSVQENAGVVRAWIRKQSADDLRLSLVLCTMFVRSESNGKVSYYIPRKHAERWFDLDAEFKRRLLQVDRGKLDRWQIYAVEQLLLRIEQKEKGIQEVEYSAFE